MTSQSVKRAAVLLSLLNIFIYPTVTPRRHDWVPFHNIKSKTGMDSNTEHYSYSKQISLIDIYSAVYGELNVSCFGAGQRWS